MTENQLHKHNIEVLGSVSASNFIGDASGLTGITSSAQWDGNLTGDAIINGSLTLNGVGEEADFTNVDIVRGFFSGSYQGDGSQLTNISLDNSNIDNLTATGSFTGSFKGDGSQLTGILNFPYQGNATITGSLIITGSKIDFTQTSAISGSIFTGSFIGDGSQLTDITSTWNGIRSGSAEITGSLTISDDVVVRDSLRLSNLNATTSVSFSTKNTTSGQIDNTVLIGYQAGESLTRSTDGIYIGYQAGNAATNTERDIAIGYQALLNNTGLATGNNYTLSDNIAIGHRAMLSNLSGFRNISIGKDSLLLNKTGIGNIAIGYEAGYSNDSGNHNITIGIEAGKDNIADSNNTLIGYFAGRNLQSNNNTAIGYRALEAEGNALDGNTALGYQAGRFLNEGEGNVFIGNNAGPGTLTTLNNKLYIANKPGPPLIEGDFDSQQITITGNIAANSISGSFIGDGSGITNIAGAVFPYQGDADITGSLTINQPQTNQTSVTIENGAVVLSEVSQSLEFANDTEAAQGGVPLGGLYRSGNNILIRLA